MAMAIPADTIYKAIKIFFKPRRIYMTEKGVILEEYSLSSISKWSIDKEKFVFNIKSKNGVTESGSHVIFTEFASVCSQFLSGLTRK